MTAGTDRPGGSGTAEERGIRLPMASSNGAEPGDAPEGGRATGAPPLAEPAAGGNPPRKVEASAVRLVLTLAVAGALAGFVIVLVHQWAQPRIEAHQAEVLREAIYEVLGGPERYETVFLADGGFTATPPAAADTAAMERVYVGYDGAGRPVGVAVAGGQPGFQDVIRLLFGYDPASGEVLGMKVLESKETPGLGDKIEKDTLFVGEFAGVATPIVGVKPGAGDGKDNEVDMITGATISSRAVIDIINARLGTLGAPLGSWWAELAADGGGGDR